MLICNFRFLVLERIIQFHRTFQIVQFLSSPTEKTIEFVSFVSNWLYPLSNQEIFVVTENQYLFFV